MYVLGQVVFATPKKQKGNYYLGYLRTSKPVLCQIIKLDSLTCNLRLPDHRVAIEVPLSRLRFYSEVTDQELLLELQSQIAQRPHIYNAMGEEISYPNLYTHPILSVKSTEEFLDYIGNEPCSVLAGK